jgi:hypothetical protein
LWTARGGGGGQNNNQVWLKDKKKEKKNMMQYVGIESGIYGLYKYYKLTIAPNIIFRYDSSHS